MLGNSESSVSHGNSAAGSVQGMIGSGMVAGERLICDMPLWRWLGPVAPGAFI